MQSEIESSYLEKEMHDYLIKDNYNIDADYFIYVRTGIEPLEFKNLLALIQAVVDTFVSDFYGLNEIELVRVVNDQYERVIIMKTTRPLKEDFTEIDLHYNFEEHAPTISENDSQTYESLIAYLKDLSIKNDWLATGVNK